MAQTLSADDIDFPRYMRQTEASVKVKPASAFADDIFREFQPREQGSRRPQMFSTKLRNTIEFRPAEVTVWAGYNGHRKSMFVSQVALDLCVQRERTLLASFEMTPSQTLARMIRQAYGVAIPTESQIAAFSRWTDGRLWMFDHMGRINPAQAIAVCRFFAEQRKGTQVVLDSMMMMCASEEHLDEQKQFTTDVVRMAQETGLHVHLVAHCRKPADGSEAKPPTKYDLRGSAAISDQAHNVITVWTNKPKKAALAINPHDEKQLEQPDAAITVEKQRNGSWEGRLKLWFDDASLRFCDDRTSPIEPYAFDASQIGGAS